MNIGKELKQKLIEYSEEIASKNDFVSIHTNDEKGKENNKIGISQYRTLAEIASNIDSYDEFELYIKYKESKGNGWDSIFDGVKYGDKIIEYMKKIKMDAPEDVLPKALSLFFGYLYWQSSYRVMPMKSDANQKNNEFGNQNSNTRNGHKYYDGKKRWFECLIHLKIDTF